jgi:hypothetical protein
MGGGSTYCLLGFSFGSSRLATLPRYFSCKDSNSLTCSSFCFSFISLAHLNRIFSSQLFLKGKSIISSKNF